ncbi:MAG: AsmA family protein [Desulfofustis sp.]
MKRLLKYIGYTVAAIVGLIAVVFISLQFVSGEQYKKWITAATESATGRRLAIDGEVDVDLNTKIGLTAHDIRFANAPWGSREELAAIDRLFVEIRLFPLFTGVLDVVVEIDAPDILLESDADGTGNWVFDTAPAEQAPPEAADDAIQDGDASFSLPVKPYIRNLEVNDLVFAYDTMAGNERIEAALEELRLFVDGADLPLIIKGSYQGAPIELQGSLGCSAGPMLPRPNTRLDIGLSADNISTFEPFAGVTLPRLEDFDLSFTLVADAGQLMLENTEADLSDPRLSGSIAGRIEDLAGLSGIQISSEISTDQGDSLAEILNLGAAYTVPKTIRLTGEVGGSLEALSVDGLEISVQDQGLDILLAADLQDVIGNVSGTANVTIDLESTSIINHHAGLDLPSFGPLKGSAGIVSADSGMELESLHIELNDPALTAGIDGSADNIGKPGDERFQISGIELSGTAKSDQIKEILARFKVDVPVELPASFSLDLGAAGSLEK